MSAPQRARNGVREWALIVLVAIAAAAGGYAYNTWRSAPAAAESEALAALTSTTLQDLENRPQAIGQWRGKVLVVNFWATWCAPCREEIPLFVKLQEKYGDRGLQFVGIAIDQPEKVKPFAAELGMNFPVLLGRLDSIELSRRLGNRAGVLPFTIVIDRSGEVASTEVGTVKENRIEPLLQKLL